MTNFKKMVALVALMAVLLVTGCSNGTPDKSGVVAKVNDQEISFELYNVYFTLYANSYKEAYGEDFLNTEYDGKTVAELLRDDITDMLVFDTLMRIHMDSEGFVFDQAKFDEKLAEFNTFLEEDEEMKAFYENSGATEAFYKEQIMTGLYNEAYVDWLTAKLDAEGATLENFIQNEVVQVRASHILVETEALALEIRASLMAGEAFESLAEIHSKDAQTGQVGGDLGYFPRGMMVAPFDEAAFSLPVGEISEPVQSDFGFHIIKVVDTQTVQDMIDAGEDEELIEYFTSNYKNTLIDDAYKNTIAELKEASDIKIFW